MAPLDVEAVEADVLAMLSLTGSSDAGLLARVSSIVAGVVQALSLRLGGMPVPALLSYVVRDVSLARYNRLGSEGAARHDVEGESVTFRTDDFAPYASDIAAAVKLGKTQGGGVVHFL